MTRVLVIGGELSAIDKKVLSEMDLGQVHIVSLSERNMESFERTFRVGEAPKWEEIVPDSIIEEGELTSLNELTKEVDSVLVNIDPEMFLFQGLCRSLNKHNVKVIIRGDKPSSFTVAFTNWHKTVKMEETENDARRPKDSI